MSYIFPIVNKNEHIFCIDGTLHNDSWATNYEDEFLTIPKRHIN